MVWSEEEVVEGMSEEAAGKSDGLMVEVRGKGMVMGAGSVGIDGAPDDQR